MNVLLDSGPLGLVTHPKPSAEGHACKAWLQNVIRQKHIIVLPEIIDFEIRRELIRVNKREGLKRLDEIKALYYYLPLDTKTMLKASEFWAAARSRGKATASDAALDIDVILAAQAWLLSQDGTFTVVATMNQKHLSQFVPAENWKDIHPL